MPIVGADLEGVPKPVERLLWVELTDRPSMTREIPRKWMSGTAGGAETAGGDEVERRARVGGGRVGWGAGWASATRRS
jgi:hypothetical protein